MQEDGRGVRGGGGDDREGRGVKGEGGRKGGEEGEKSGKGEKRRVVDVRCVVFQ